MFCLFSTCVSIVSRSVLSIIDNPFGLLLRLFTTDQSSMGFKITHQGLLIQIQIQILLLTQTHQQDMVIAQLHNKM